MSHILFHARDMSARVPSFDEGRRHGQGLRVLQNATAGTHTCGQLRALYLQVSIRAGVYHERLSGMLRPPCERAILRRRTARGRHPCRDGDRMMMSHAPYVASSLSVCDVLRRRMAGRRVGRLHFVGNDSTPDRSQLDTVCARQSALLCGRLISEHEEGLCFAHVASECSTCASFKICMHAPYHINV
jgi:hypothetical protein